jgi:hypothetical protein
MGNSAKSGRAAAIRALGIEDGILVAVGIATQCIEKVQQYNEIGVEQLLLHPPLRTRLGPSDEDIGIDIDPP